MQWIIYRQLWPKKIDLFQERCDKIDVPNNDFTREFSIMLNGDALEYYLDNLRQKNLSFIDLVQAMKDRFLTRERTRAFLREWDLLSLTANCLKIGQRRHLTPWSWFYQEFLKSRQNCLMRIRMSKFCATNYWVHFVTTAIATLRITNRQTQSEVSYQIYTPLSQHQNEKLHWKQETNHLMLTMSTVGMFGAFPVAVKIAASTETRNVWYVIVKVVGKLITA